MHAPLNYFLHANGPAANPTLLLGWIYSAIAVLVCVIIAVLLLIAIFRKRPVEKERAIGRGEGGLRWIYIGTGLSVIVLFGMMIYALVTLNQVATPASAPAFTIHITGYDWWWKVEYENADPAQRFTTANEIHIPTGVPVEISLNSADVIHAFWVPELAGKTEMIPGLTNRQWVQADVPGIYHGKCTQFCGVQHAHMDFEVVAQRPENFEAWKKAQLLPALMPSNTQAQAGRKIFMEQCAGCHGVKGSEADGDHAPNLTHLASRRLLAAGLLTNTPEHLADWIAHVQKLKPGARMPDFALSLEENDALMAYLATLK